MKTKQDGELSFSKIFKHFLQTKLKTRFLRPWYIMYQKQCMQATVKLFIRI